MRPIQSVRTKIFRVTQAEFGAIAGTTQASVSRWENGSQDPSLPEMERIRNEARDRNIDWKDEYFFKAIKDEASVA